MIAKFKEQAYEEIDIVKEDAPSFQKAKSSNVGRSIGTFSMTSLLPIKVTSLFFNNKSAKKDEPEVLEEC